MSNGVEFNEENNLQSMAQRVRSDSAPKGFTKWLIDRGFAKSEKSAASIQVGIVVFNIILAIIIINIFL